MALFDIVKKSLRVSHDLTDDEIQMLVDAAIEDMRRCGVREDLLVEETMSPTARNAVTLFAKSMYGYDNAEAARFLDSYRLALASLLNSKSNEYLFPDGGDG